MCTHLFQKTFKLTLELSVLSWIAISPSLNAQLPQGRKDGHLMGPDKFAQTKTAAILNINNLVSWYRANGQGQYGPPSLQGDGDAFPRGTSHPFFADGVVWGGKAYLDAAHTQPAPFQVIRVGGGTYNVGNREGWIGGTGANAVAVPSSDPRARIYRIRRDYTTMSNEELRLDALENFY